MKKKQFFRNFFPIILYGIVGVFISTAIITAGEPSRSQQDESTTFAFHFLVTSSTKAREKILGSPDDHKIHFCPVWSFDLNIVRSAGTTIASNVCAELLAKKHDWISPTSYKTVGAFARSESMVQEAET